MARRNHHRQNDRKGLIQMEAVTRVTNIPLVESSLILAENMYGRLKNSNPLMTWTLSVAEEKLHAIGNHALPAIAVLHTPLQKLDKILCKSLDIMEQRVPSVYLPPQLMYWNTKEYMTDHLVKPVLRRADSVKHLGNAVLESRMTNFAADRLDGALNVADKYVDKFLPDTTDATDGVSDVQKRGKTDNGSKAVKTMHHMDRFSRKLQRRLTRRTLAEAKALREQIHVIIYVAELVATDPKLALQKAQELWKTLSLDEPENQARPETLEQLMVMLTRESARRFVHLINFTSSGVSKLPKVAVHSLRVALHQCTVMADSLVKKIHLDGARNDLISESKKVATRMQILLNELQHYTSNILERLAVFLAGRGEEVKPRVRRTINCNNHNSTVAAIVNNINGLQYAQ